MLEEERGEGRGRAFELDDEDEATISEGGVDSDRSRGGFLSVRLGSGGGGRPEGAFNASTSMSFPRAFEIALKSNPAVGGSFETGSEDAMSGLGEAEEVVGGEGSEESVLGRAGEEGPSSRGGRSSSSYSGIDELDEAFRLVSELVAREVGLEVVGLFLRENQRFCLASRRASSSSSVMMIRSSWKSGSCSIREEGDISESSTTLTGRREGETNLRLVEVVGSHLEKRRGMRRVRNHKVERARRRGRRSSPEAQHYAATAASSVDTTYAQRSYP